MVVVTLVVKSMLSSKKSLTILSEYILLKNEGNVREFLKEVKRLLEKEELNNAFKLYRINGKYNYNYNGKLPYFNLFLLITIFEAWMNSKGNEPFLNWAEKQPNIYGNVMISSLQDKTMGFSNHFPDEKHNRGYALCVDIQNKD